MTIIFKKKLVNINGKYEVNLLQDDMKLWLILVDLSSLKLIASWSSHVKDQKIMSYTSVVESLEARLKQAEKKQTSIDDAVEFWPKYWDYWGRFTPEPIKYYINLLSTN